MGTYYGRLACFVFAVCCCLAVISIVNIAFATTNTEYMYGTMSNGKVAYKSAAQMRLDKLHTYSFQKVPDQVARYVPKNKTFKPSYTSAQLSGMVKNVGKNTLGWAAVMGAVAAAGWAIDELTGQVTNTTMQPDPNFDPITDPQTGFHWHYNLDGQSNYSSTPDQLITSLGGTPVYDDARSRVEILSPTSVRYVNYTINGQWSSWTFGRQECSTCVYEENLIPVTTTVTDAQFNDQVLPKFLGLPNSQIETAINTLPQTPQLSDMLDDWLSDVADRSPDLSYNPATKNLTYTDPNTGIVTEIETAQPDYTQDGTESFTDVAGTDWPAACDWFPKLCEWLDWTQEFDEPVAVDMPFEDFNLADIQEDFDSGLGSGSCPAPQTASFMGETIEYSFETACMASETYFKPILLTMGAIMAGFIIVGATRKGV